MIWSTTDSDFVRYFSRKILNKIVKARCFWKNFACFYAKINAQFFKKHQNYPTNTTCLDYETKYRYGRGSFLSQINTRNKRNTENDCYYERRVVGFKRAFWG